MSAAPIVDRPLRHWLPRLLGVAGALISAVPAIVGTVLATVLLHLIADGDEVLSKASDQAAAGVARSSGEAGHLAAAAADTGVQKVADSILGSVAGSAQTFRALVVAGVVLSVAALYAGLRRRPEEIWPEVLWAATAAVCLLPALVLGPWAFAEAPGALLLVCAAGVHAWRRTRAGRLPAAAARAVAPAGRRAADVATQTAMVAVPAGSQTARTAADAGARAIRTAAPVGLAAGKAAGRGSIRAARAASAAARRARKRRDTDDPDA